MEDGERLRRADKCGNSIFGVPGRWKKLILTALPLEVEEEELEDVVGEEAMTLKKNMNWHPRLPLGEEEGEETERM